MTCLGGKGLQTNPYLLSRAPVGSDRHTQHAVLTVAISQIQSDGPCRTKNILALPRRDGANLLHCPSPFYLASEHVDNLGAYTPSRPETGLLIPSAFVSNPMVAST